MTKEATSQQGKRISLLEVPVVRSNLSSTAEDAMKTCPECSIALRDEYQFCPEDGATLGETTASGRIEESASAKSQA
ncbi:MAG: hypothetical protein ACJ74G_23595, partial [Blastocatellia bacterium]